MQVKSYFMYSSETYFLLITIFWEFLMLKCIAMFHSFSLLSILWTFYNVFIHFLWMNICFFFLNRYYKQCCKKHSLCMSPCSQVQEFLGYLRRRCNTSTLYVTDIPLQGGVQQCYVIPIQCIRKCFLTVASSVFS